MAQEPNERKCFELIALSHALPWFLFFLFCFWCGLAPIGGVSGGDCSAREKERLVKYRSSRSHTRCLLLFFLFLV